MKVIVFTLFLLVGYIDLIDPASTTKRVDTTRVTQQTIGSTPTRPTPIYCYNCAYCPRPFNSHSANVEQAYSPLRWCVKMSDTDSSNAIYSRGPDPGYCSLNGCSWKTTFGIRQWVCCCNQNLCNVALPATKSSIAISLSSLIILVLTTRII